MTAPVARRAGRVLLVDAHRRLLLFRGGDPAAPELGTWWFTPGGGLDDGETHAQGAARELLEETGLDLAPESLGDSVLDRDVEFSFDGRLFAQSEQFFLARVEAHEVDTAGFSPLEVEAVFEHRWWTLDDLAATDETIYPLGLAELLTRLGV